MPVRDQNAPQQTTKSRSGMFKWMISGHKGHKHKQDKLNNAVLNNKNKNNLKHQQQQQQPEQHNKDEQTQGQQQHHQQQQQQNGLLHITEPATDDCNTVNPTRNGGNQINSHQPQEQYQSLPQHCNQPQTNGDINQNIDKSDVPSTGLTGGPDNEQIPPPPSTRPPPPPTHPPPPVPSHSQILPQPPQQPLPPVPVQHDDNEYQQDYRQLQAPGTCTLPRRGLVREEPSSRYRSPSNPPPASRQPPPYSRHQPPDPIRKSRGPYQPPPPPKTDSGDPRERWDPRDDREFCKLQEASERNSRGSNDRHGTAQTHDFVGSREKHPQDLDFRDKWERRDRRETYNTRERRESRNFHEILDSWEKREAKEHTVPNREDHSRSSSLPRGNYDNWVSKSSRWNSRDPDSGFDSLNNPNFDTGPRSLDSSNEHQAYQGINDDCPYSQSTEDLLNASRTSPDSILSGTGSSVSSSPVQYPTIRPAKQPCINGALHHSSQSHGSPHGGSSLAIGSPNHHSTPIVQQRPPSREEALLSDSVYPQQENQPRYAEIPDVMEQRGREEQINKRFSRDQRELSRPIDSRDVREPRNTRTYNEQRNMHEIGNSQEARSNNRQVRETSLPRDFRDIRESRNALEVREDRDRLSQGRDFRGFRERSVDGDDRDITESRQERGRRPRDPRNYSSERTELSKEVRFSKDLSEGLRVRDTPSYERRDRDADGADDLQVTEQRRGSISNSNDREQQQESRRGDGATSSSVSWMEWTQQLQAYVAWVNSQLRKRGRPLITDLRRDLQSGVVFADLIEIISGERVAGISREGNTVQSMRENLERILQFMAAKRIRMTHITSKEVVEGNLKSIMRIILALAAHYKPQSVKSSASPPSASASTGSQQQVAQNQDAVPSSSSRATQQHPSTHDVGVGPEPPVSSAEKTPNLSANRRAIMTGGASEEPTTGIVGLRRHPSMTAPQSPSVESSPVYENLPRRSGQNRWAYDSLRPSHKFQWNASQGLRNGPPSLPPKPNLDESSDDPLNTSFNASLNNSLNTSLNTSLDGDVEVPSPRHDSAGSRNPLRPGASNFWSDINTRRDSNAPSPDQHPQSQNSTEDADNPFRYHTIHRMSGRRKLPRIPGASAGASGSRITTPRDDSESPRIPNDLADRGSEDVIRVPNNGAINDEGSREPEGRSQNSSPATSLIRGPTLDQWPKDKKNPLDPWEQESELKGVLRDLNNTRDQLLALQHLELDPALRVNHSSRTQELVSESTSTAKQEILHLSIARQALEAEKMELKRLLEQRENIITELRKQMHHRDKTIQAQRTQFEDALRNLQNGKRTVNVGDNGIGRSNGGNISAGGTREELQLVRDAIISLRTNFRGTDPNQHTLDTLEQAIAVLIERCGGLPNGSGGVSGGSGNPGNCGVTNGIINAPAEKTSRPGDKRQQINGSVEPSTKVIYFTERTVTPFMSTISKRLGEIRLRDFKNMFDRPGLFRFHFKSHDPEYGMVKEEIVNDDDILPGVEGKIIAWVEEDNE